MSENVIVCDVDPETKERMEQFRKRQEKNIAAIIMKIDPEKMTVGIDEEHEDISIDDLREELPAHQPRPQGFKPELQMMYAGSKSNAVNTMGFTKVFEVRSTEEITDDWLTQKLKLFR